MRCKWWRKSQRTCKFQFVFISQWKLNFSTTSPYVSLNFLTHDFYFHVCVFEIYLQVVVLYTFYQRFRARICKQKTWQILPKLLNSWCNGSMSDWVPKRRKTCKCEVEWSEIKMKGENEWKLTQRFSRSRIRFESYNNKRMWLVLLFIASET